MTIWNREPAAVGFQTILGRNETCPVSLYGFLSTVSPLVLCDSPGCPGKEKGTEQMRVCEQWAFQRTVLKGRNIRKKATTQRTAGCDWCVNDSSAVSDL